MNTDFVNNGSLNQNEIDSLLIGVSHSDRFSTERQANGNKHKTEVLTQDEIDQLLTEISGTGYSPLDSAFAEGFNPDKFITSLIQHSTRTEPIIGMFTKNASVIRFSTSDKGEEILADIKALNEKQGGGNIKVAGSTIELINFSACPQCKKIYSFKDLVSYYSTPVFDMSFPDRSTQLRQDTRVKCSECGSYFLPALVISDGIPKNEVQFLCRVQTVQATESHIKLNHGKSVLTKNARNIVETKKEKYILNDVDISHLQSSPSLIVNILQYSTPKLMINFLEGRNKINRDPLFGIFL